MKIIAERNIKASVKNHGFEGLNEQAHNLIEKSLKNFVSLQVEKAQKIAQKEGKNVIEEKHVQQVGQKKQRGGAETTLPLEYFGVDSKHYFENAPLGTDMGVTASTIRPAFVVNDPAGVIKGGGNNKFNVPFTAVQSVCKQQNVQIRNQAQKLIQQKFESVFGEVVSKTAKKFGNNQLKGSELEQVLQQHKYQKLFKQ